MKKILALALALMLCLCSVAFAEEQDLTNYLDKPVVVEKTYTINNGTSPAEMFTFKFEGVSFVNGDGEEVADATIPAIPNQTISFDALTAESVKDVDYVVDADAYELGVYTYKVTEVVPSTKTSGVNYSEEELYLVLTILRDEDSKQHYVAAMHYQSATGTDKETGFTNEYDAGQLAVTKEIEGNMADMSKKFTFAVIFTPETSTAFNNDVQIVTDNATTQRNYTETTENGATKFVFELGDGETATFTNVPAGTTYTVTEDAENYTSDNGVFSDSTKTIEANDKDEVTFTNKLDTSVDTGIAMDSAPYMIVLALVVVAGVMMMKKRSYNA